MVTIKKFSRKANAEMVFSVDERVGYLWVSINGSQPHQIFDNRGDAVITSPSNLKKVASKFAREIAATIVYINDIYNGVAG